MGKQDDSLTKVDGPDRVHYETGVLLNAEDFLAEQNYHRGRLARALAYINGSGTLAGLKIEYKEAVEADEELDRAAQAERILIHAGIAIDRPGRLIEVPRAICMRIGEWYEQQKNNDLREAWHATDEMWSGSAAGVVVDVFIRFVSCERGKTPVFSLGPFDSIDAVTAARLRDGYEAELVLRKETNPGEPVSPWPDFSSTPETERPEMLRNAIFSAWRGSTDANDLQGLNPLAEHASGQDTTSLFLARLIIPADESISSGSPNRREGEAVQVRNDLRSFIITANALAAMSGINITAEIS